MGREGLDPPLNDQGFQVPTFNPILFSKGRDKQIMITQVHLVLYQMTQSLNDTKNVKISAKRAHWYLN